MRENGIGVQVHYVPIHRQPAYASVASHHLVATDVIYERILSLPLYPRLTNDQQDLVVSVLADAIASTS